jgi:Flp pilus assembly protein TadD/lysophospholipase L1-like esterase
VGDDSPALKSARFFLILSGHFHENSGPVPFMVARPKQTEGESPRTRNRKSFWLVIILTPFLALGAAEAVLRWFDYGGTLDLVVKTRVMGKEWYTLNPRVARRYFLQKGISVPEPSDDLFEINKQQGTKRIFMLGESTMAGFPYDYSATAPRLLQDRLKQLLPQFNIEVINVGLSAVNSYTTLDFMRELVQYHPDAFIVYVGHNEFYGAMGVGSTEYLGRWHSLIQLYMTMLKSKLFLLIRDGVTTLHDLVSHPEAHPGADLMEMMVRKKTIPYHGDEYNRAKQNFEKNLGDMASLAADHRVPLVLCTLTSNIRNQRPFMPLFSETTPDSLRSLWNRFVGDGRTAGQRSDWPRAAASFRQAIGVDSMEADAHFELARCLDTLRRATEAKAEYQKARDLDGLRFRASTEFNDLIRSICREHQLFLDDVDRVFDQQSPDGIVGRNLILEHLHPNGDGYFLLAKSFLNSLAENDVLAPRSEWHRDRDLSDERFKEISGVTDFELEAAQYRVFRLTNRWPFKPPGDSGETYRSDTRVRQLAAQYVQKRIGWSDAHYALADWYRSNGDNGSAIREYSAVSKVLPGYYYPVMLTGDVFRAMKNDRFAELTYRRALALQASPFIHARLGMLYFDGGDTRKAIEEFESVFTADSSGSERVDAKARAVAHYFLGVAYGKIGDLEKARMHLRSTLELDPQDEDAKKLLSQLQHGS